MKTKPAAWVGPILGLLIFSLAIWVLHRELAAYRFQDIIQQVHAIPAGRAAMALLLTAAAYGVMTLYDLLALRYLKQSLSYAKIALAAFVGASFSNNIGLSMLAGASVRYRLYANWGLSTGMGLLLLARGLQRRLNGAYWITLTMLVLGVVVSLLKGLDYEEALFLLILLAALLPSRHFFYRQPGLSGRQILSFQP
jgi:uncharacterized membrane protein YbhN (UPF0104 family)